MSKIARSRKLVVVLLFALLLGPWQLTAATQPALPAPNGVKTPLALIQGILLQFWNGCWGVDSPKAISSSVEAGSGIDPWGNHATSSVQVTSDIGSEIDPWGSL